jgi:hypothetical protein
MEEIEIDTLVEEFARRIPDTVPELQALFRADANRATVQRIGKAILRFVSFWPLEAKPYMSSHYNPETYHQRSVNQ